MNRAELAEQINGKQTHLLKEVAGKPFLQGKDYKQLLNYQCESDTVMTVHQCCPRGGDVLILTRRLFCVEELAIR